MTVSGSDAVRTSQATAGASQPQLTNAAAANLFFNPYQSVLPGLNPLQAQANLSSVGFTGADAAGHGGLGNSNAAASDADVQLANALSRLMLGQLASNWVGLQLAAANQGILAPGLAGLTPQSLLHNAALLQAYSGSTLLSPADQQQLLDQTATHTSVSSGIHSTTTASGLAPVSHRHSGLGAQSANPADSAFAHSLHESAHPRNFGPPR